MYIRIALATVLLWCAGCTQVSTPGSRNAGQPGAATPGTASATGLPVPARLARATSFADLPDHGDLVTYPTRPVVRPDGAYTWHRAGLSEEHALRAVGGVMQITTPAGEQLQFQYERHVEHPSGDWTWVGRAKGGARSDEVVLTFGERAAFGTISQPGQAPLKLTMRDGVSWLVETDRSKIAGIEGPATRPRKPDFLIPPKTNAGSGTSMESSPAAALSTTAGAQAVATTTVDVLLGYTGGFAAAQGGQSQAMTRLYNMVEITNQGYVNSQVDARVRLVHAMQVNYPDNTSNETTLEALTGFQAPRTRTTPDPAFAGLRSARDQYGADLVSLVRDFNTPENEGCGIAWLVGGNQEEIGLSDEEFGYSVVSDGSDAGTDGKTYFCREETLAHELGHNMGSQHDRTSATVDGAVNYGAYPYSFGQKTDASSGNFYTVMAYGDKGQVSYRTFSTPRTTFCGGYSCGITDQADNARSLGQTIPVVAGFRATVVTSPPVTRRVTADVDGDAHSDILWHNAGAGQFGHWLMNGATVKQMASQPVATGYRLPASGDFDGNGKMDALWTSDARDLWMWSGTGAGTFVSNNLGTYSGNWALSAAGDINADGKDDILWHSAADGQLSYWLMNGAAVTKIINIPVTVGYRIASSGDFNGDGRLDLFWTSNKGDLWLWSGTPDGQFTSNFMGTYGYGWAVIGSGDVNADGMDDLLWHNAIYGRLSYWLLNGPSVVQTAEIGVAVGYRVASTGDYNGDGRVDLVWTSSNLDLWMWSGNGSGFASNFLGNYGGEWRVVDPDVR